MAARWRSKAIGVLSGALIAGGSALLVVSLAYLVYAKFAEARLSALNRVSQETVLAPPSAVQADRLAREPLASKQPLVQAAEDGTAQGRAAPPGDAPKARGLVPFTPGAAFPPPARVQIPRLDIDSRTVALGTVIEEGQLVWETPKWAVGHHKGTANPGEVGNMVLSGHISSPLRHEGNVFQQLPEIQLGDEVIVTSDAGSFFYRVTETKVVTPDRIEVMDPTPEPVATLITCVPDWVYTHRLIVIARPYRWEDAGQGYAAKD